MLGCVFFFKQKTAYEMLRSLVGSEMCIRDSMRTWGLKFGAIDMVITPNDHYVFLEVNPAGQWGWIEDLTQLPIAEAIATLLKNGR